jgi:hypothetical protein
MTQAAKTGTNQWGAFITPATGEETFFLTSRTMAILPNIVPAQRLPVGPFTQQGVNAISNVLSITSSFAGIDPKLIAVNKFS